MQRVRDSSLKTGRQNAFDPDAAFVLVCVSTQEKCRTIAMVKDEW
jgi:hypothetical protein